MDVNAVIQNNGKNMLKFMIFKLFINQQNHLVNIINLYNSRKVLLIILQGEEKEQSQKNENFLHNTSK